MKINITKEQVGSALKSGGKLVLTAFIIGFASLVKDKACSTQTYIGEVGYGDAVSAILSSDMFDYNKTKAIELLKRDESGEYYRAVISAINSELFDSNKIRTIETLSKK